MPNWCYTRITFHGNKAEIEDFYNKINTCKNHIDNGFGQSWLGNILFDVGLGDRIDALENSIRCRGSIAYVEDIEVNSDDDATFFIDTETAWVPMIKMWVETIKVLDYKTVGFSYLAEEIGFEIYEIYDPYNDYDESFYVDTFLCGEDENNANLLMLEDHIYYGSEQELIKMLQVILNTEENDFVTLKDKIENYPFKDEDSYISIHEYDVITDLTNVD